MISQEIKNKAVELYKTGITKKQISKELKIDPSSVSKILLEAQDKEKPVQKLDLPKSNIDQKIRNVVKEEISKLLGSDKKEIIAIKESLRMLFQNQKGIVNYLKAEEEEKEGAQDGNKN